MGTRRWEAVVRLFELYMNGGPLDMGLVHCV
jgi:hypothetical protein